MRGPGPQQTCLACSRRSLTPLRAARSAPRAAASHTLHRTALAALRPCAGKTLQTISVLWTLLRQGPVHNGLLGGAECVNAIVISPTSLALNWKAEVP